MLQIDNLMWHSGVGVRHLATHFLHDQQILLPNELACL